MQDSKMQGGNSTQQAAGKDLAVVIVGAGQAGGELATQLRRQGHTGPITLLGREEQLPYQRPPLSKAFLLGEIEEDALTHTSAEVMARNDIRFLNSVEVVAIDRLARSVHLADGTTLAYDRLALATGGRARDLPRSIHGGDADNLYVLRTIADARRLRPELIEGRRLLVVGGGYIGLEMAAVARKRGLGVTLLEAAPRLLERSAGSEIASFLEAEHRRQGVDLRLGIALEAIETRNGRAVAALCQDGSRIEFDLIVVGIGLVPEDGLATASGLSVDSGILVDERCLTSDPDIVAVGDCTRHRNLFLGQGLHRLESVPNALEQARIAAATILGNMAAYDAVPWFWSDQYDLKLQMVGLATPDDQPVVRGDPASRSFAVFHLCDGVISAVQAVNKPADFMAGRRLVAARTRAEAALLADPAFSLKTLIVGSGVPA